MRDYAKVSPQFWIGETGKRLRAAGPEAQIVAMYLVTSPHANMIGLYYLPKLFLEHETGLDKKGASKGLAGAIQSGFCEYDDTSEMVWVRLMAAYQVGESLAPTDKRCKGIQKEYDGLPDNPFLGLFFDHYAGPFNLTTKRSPSEGACKGLLKLQKPLRSQETETETETETEKKGAKAPRPSKRCPPDFQPDPEFALREIPDLDLTREVQKFRDYEFTKPRSDWPAVWRNWISNARDKGWYSKKANGYDPYKGAL